ncbi:hypothetical protein Q5752_005753 [Cryptotrichosporon argae]
MALSFAIAPAVEATAAPPIPKAQAWGRQYEATASAPLLDLSQGVPGTAPHASLLTELARTSADPASARYGPIMGEPVMRAGFAGEIRVRYELGEGDVSAEDVGITTGCNMAFLVLLMTLCPPGSSVMLPLPTYFNHAMCLSLQSLTPVYIPCSPSSAFAPSIEAARAAFASATPAAKPRMIVLTSPNNPTGATYTPAQLRAWFDLAKQNAVALVLDETYREFVDGPPHELFKDPEWRSTLVSLGSFSKGYRIPGHRLGSIIASPALLERITTVADCMQICAPRPPQRALGLLLPSLRADVHASSAALARRRQLFTQTVEAVPGWEVRAIGGFFAFVAFPEAYARASAALGIKRKHLGSEDIAKALALKAGVLVLPGSFFMPDLDSDVWDAVEGKEELMGDRWLRFAVANVSDDVVMQLGPRLQQMNALLGVE